MIGYRLSEQSQLFQWQKTDKASSILVPYMLDCTELWSFWRSRGGHTGDVWQGLPIGGRPYEIMSFDPASRVILPSIGVSIWTVEAADSTRGSLQWSAMAVVWAHRILPRIDVLFETHCLDMLRNVEGPQLHFNWWHERQCFGRILTNYWGVHFCFWAWYMWHWHYQGYKWFLAFWAFALLVFSYDHVAWLSLVFKYHDLQCGLPTNYATIANPYAWDNEPLWWLFNRFLMGRTRINIARTTVHTIHTASC